MRASAFTGAAAAATALAVVLSGCGSDKPAASTSSSSSASSSSSTKASTATSKAPVAEPEVVAGPNPTIADYIKENNIAEIPIALGDSSAPAINLPPLEGWTILGGADVPQGVYGAAVYAGPEFGEDPPTIVAIYSKLTGKVDPQQILALAPGEINNLPGYTPGNTGEESSLGDYPAYVLGGTYTKNGAPRLIAQKTVIIPAGDGVVYVLQLNVDGPDGSSTVVGTATDAIDSQTTIS